MVRGAWGLKTGRSVPWCEYSSATVTRTRRGAQGGDVCLCQPSEQRPWVRARVASIECLLFWVSLPSVLHCARCSFVCPYQSCSRHDGSMFSLASTLDQHCRRVVLAVVLPLAVAVLEHVCKTDIRCNPLGTFLLPSDFFICPLAA